MQISVEISYYPLQIEYIPPILSFIDRLKADSEIVVKSNGISSHVFGNYGDVMKALTIEIEKAFEFPHSVFVLKIINSDKQIYTKSDA